MIRKRRLSAHTETWPLAAPFRISRGSKSEARVVVVEIGEEGVRGRGEAVPYARYGQTIESVLGDIADLARAVEDGAGRRDIASLASAAPSARNAVDCALWDLEAKLTGIPVWRRAGLDEPRSLVTALTIGIGSPREMGRAARDNAGRALLKVKLDGELVVERVRAVREGAPEARLVVDANEAWDMGLLRDVAGELAAAGVEMIEQPLPAGEDGELDGHAWPVTLCADESCHTGEGIDALAGRYGMVNIKLDKTGGFSGALALARAARGRGLRTMVGCMVSTSLAMAPAFLAAQDADIADLDGPLILRRDRVPGMDYEGSLVHPPPERLWG